MEFIAQYKLACREKLDMPVGPSVRPSFCPSVHHIFEFRAVFTLLLLPNHPPLDCRVSGLVDFRMHKKIKNLKMLRMDGHTDRPESHVHPSKTISIVLENIIYSRSMRLSIGEYNYKLNLEKS